MAAEQPQQPQQQPMEAVECPICGKSVAAGDIEAHVNRCLDHPEDASQQQAAMGVACPMCGAQTSLSLVHYLYGCSHFFCRDCLHTLATTRISERRCSELRCPTCRALLTARDLRELLNEEELAQHEAACVAEAVTSEGFVTCPGANCGAVIELVAGGATTEQVAVAMRTETTPDGRPLSEEAARHRCEYRLRCRACGTEFCAGCGATPYHQGFTCDGFVSYGKAAHCRFCGEQVSRGKSVCGKEECAAKLKLACTKTLPCGHLCGGIRGERTCLRCMNADCKEAEAAAAAAGAGAQTGDDYCNICWVEGLSSAPSIQIKCGHIFHYSCLLNKIAARWPGARITFGFLQCPLCKQEIAHPALDDAMKEVRQLRDVVRGKALERLRQMGLERSDDIVKPGGPFHNDPLGYAMHHYSYFLCYKCRQPYYGGERVCEGNAVVEYDPKELLCSRCCNFEARTECPIHGSEYITWKCKFCCNVACWFCWGTTHFCDACHKKASEMARKPVSQLPRCTCTFKHPPNGTAEFCFGCSLCRLKKTCFS